MTILMTVLFSISSLCLFCLASGYMEQINERIEPVTGTANTDLSAVDVVYTRGHCAILAAVKRSSGFSIAARKDGGFYCVPAIRLSQLQVGITWQRFEAQRFQSQVPLLRRKDGSVDFFRPWNDYKSGFGTRDGELWLGLETLHRITSARDYGLYVIMEDWDGETFWAYYSNFRIGPENDNYRLSVTGYDLTSTAGDSLAKHNGMEFSTPDRDNDAWGAGQCSTKYHAAWWYRACRDTSPTGRYLVGGLDHIEGISWSSVPVHVKYYSFKRIILTLVPSQ